MMLVRARQRLDVAASWRSEMLLSGTRPKLIRARALGRLGAFRRRFLLVFHFTTWNQ